jgi:hypothetical protein
LRRKLDTQQIESLGRAALAAQLIGDGLEVAQPERDAGIDLLAFSVNPWKVVPIQMKVATNEGFSVHRKYKRVPGLVGAPLVMVYVWNALAAEKLFYAMTWTQAAEVAERLGWTKTPSWKKSPWWSGGYGTTKPSQRVKEAIAPHKMEPGKWGDLLLADR